MKLRITLLMIATLLLVTVTILGAFYFQHLDSEPQSRARLAPRLGAIVALIDANPAAADRVLSAASAPDFRLSVHAGPLDSSERDDYPRAARLLQSRDASLQAHALRISGAGPLRVLHGGDDSTPRDNARVAVALADGRVLVVEVQGATLRRVLGRPFASIALLLVGIIGLGALWALRKQIRPLEALALAVERVGTVPAGNVLPEAGPREVRQLVSAFNRMQERIVGLIAARTRLLGAISHDLGTYLTRLRLRIDLIGDDEQRTRAERDLLDMQQLLRDALALASSEPSGTAAVETVDLVALARREVEECRQAGADVTLAAPSSLLVQGRALALARVFSNVLGNALKYAGDARLQLRHDEAWAEIIVDDRGPGIPVAEREAVLEPFYRRDTARTLDAGGSGLGLAIVADIVCQHCGELQLTDAPGGGLRVCIRLPAATVTT